MLSSSVFLVCLFALLQLICARDASVRTDITSHIAELRESCSREVDNLRKELHSVTSRFNAQAHELYELRRAATGAFGSYGCELDILRLSCPDGRTINVTDAYFGQYAGECTACCPPDAVLDCRSAMLDVRPIDWAALKLTCDNATTCDYQNVGSLIEICDSPFHAEYLDVYYDCLPDDGIPPGAAPNVTGFAAYALGSTSYSSGDTLIFENVITNVGDGYDATTGEFTCPVTGTYAFSLSIIHETNQLIADIVSGFTTYGTAYTFYDDDYDQGSVSVVILCDAGQVVRAECASSGGTLFGGTNRLGSMFSGYLLQ